jgi:hypothetical protein
MFLCFFRVADPCAAHLWTRNVAAHCSVTDANANWWASDYDLVEVPGRQRAKAMYDLNSFYSNESEILYEPLHGFGQGRGSGNEVMVKINVPKVHSYQPLIKAGNSNASMHVLLDVGTILNRYTILCSFFSIKCVTEFLKQYCMIRS